MIQLSPPPNFSIDDFGNLVSVLQLADGTLLCEDELATMAQQLLDNYDVVILDLKKTQAISRIRAYAKQMRLAWLEVFEGYGDYITVNQAAFEAVKAQIRSAIEGIQNASSEDEILVMETGIVWPSIPDLADVEIRSTDVQKARQDIISFIQANPVVSNIFTSDLATLDLQLENLTLAQQILLRKFQVRIYRYLRLLVE